MKRRSTKTYALISLIFASILIASCSSTAQESHTSIATSSPPDQLPRLKSLMAADIARAEAAVTGCAPISQGDDPGCARALATMVQVAFKIRDTAKERPDSARYAKAIATVNSMVPLATDFNDDRCGLGYTPALMGGGTARDQACSADGLSLVLSWQTLGLNLDTVEPDVYFPPTR